MAGIGSSGGWSGGPGADDAAGYEGFGSDGGTACMMAFVLKRDLAGRAESILTYLRSRSIRDALLV